MDNAVIVRGFKCLGNLPRDRQRVVERDRAARDALREILAFDQFHDERRDSARFFEPVDVRDVRVIQRCQHLRLAAEARQAIGIVGDGGQQHLDRDVAIQLGVAGAIDRPHSTGAESGEDFVRAEARAG